MTRTIASILTVCAAIIGVQPDWAAAGETGPEARFEHSTVRLLTGGRAGDGWDAGIEIIMGEGWKTYWRVPGESGVPPNFDWNGSTNLESVHIDWPAPTRYRDQAGESIGYKDRVVYPLYVMPSDAAQPVQLKLNLFYAVCDEICIPGSAQLAATLTEATASDADRAVIAEFRRRIPSRSAGPVAVTGSKIAADEDGLALAVTVKGLDAPDAADIFVEGAEEYYFRKPQYMGKRDRSELYYLRVDGLDAPEDLVGRTVELTITTPSTAVARKVAIE